MTGNVTLLSFAFKNGAPDGADMMFDVRFLKNPFYEPSLKSLTGLDEAAAAYIETDPDFAPFFEHLSTLADTVLRHRAEGEQEDCTIAVGCTGGIHRSVHVVQKLGGFLQQKGYKVTLIHRDLKP